jgi:hypothetical protein
LQSRSNLAIELPQIGEQQIALPLAPVVNTTLLYLPLPRLAAHCGVHGRRQVGTRALTTHSFAPKKKAAPRARHLATRRQKKMEHSQRRQFEPTTRKQPTAQVRASRGGRSRILRRWIRRGPNNSRRGNCLKPPRRDLSIGIGKRLKRRTLRLLLANALVVTVYVDAERRFGADRIALVKRRMPASYRWRPAPNVAQLERNIEELRMADITYCAQGRLRGP